MAVAVGIGAAGGLAAFVAGLPAAWLSGAAVAVALAAGAGVRVRMPPRLRGAAFLVLGTGMGSAVTPDAFASVAEWPFALLALFVTVAAVTVLGIVVLRRVGRMARADAVLASIPGALSHVMATAIEIEASLPRVALAQSLRLLVMVAVLPPLVTTLGGAAGAFGAGLPAEAGHVDALVMLVPSVAAGLIAHRLGMPAGLLLGAFVASAALHGFGVVETRLPQVVLDPAFVVLGTAIGAAFAGIDLRTLLRPLTAASLALAGALVVSLAAAFAFARATGAPFGEIALAFAPGGIEAMITLAFLMGYDVPFVATLHLVRVFGLILALPLILRLAGARGPPAPPREPS